MNISERGLKELKNSEGSRSHMYQDSAGHPTIGVGHLLTPLERRTGHILIEGIATSYSHGLTDEQILKLLAQDVTEAETAVRGLVCVDLNQNQFDALVNFVFNIGRGQFADSTMLKYLNSDNYVAASAEFPKWRIANGKVDRGLVARRIRERDLFDEPMDVPSVTPGLPVVPLEPLGETVEVPVEIVEQIIDLAVKLQQLNLD